MSNYITMLHALVHWPRIMYPILLNTSYTYLILSFNVLRGLSPISFRDDESVAAELTS